MSPKLLTVNQCQFQNARGQRCNMLIDTNHRHGTGPATRCAFHAQRLRAKTSLVDAPQPGNDPPRPLVAGGPSICTGWQEC